MRDFDKFRDELRAQLELAREIVTAEKLAIAVIAIIFLTVVLA